MRFRFGRNLGRRVMCDIPRQIVRVPARLLGFGPASVLGRVSAASGNGSWNPFPGRIETMPVSQELLDILACPKCKGTLSLSESKDALDCAACNLRYRIEDDIPIMLIDEATPIG